MAVQYQTGVLGFNVTPDFYQAPANTLRGAAAMTAAALILLEDDETGDRPIFGNFDSGASKGWKIEVKSTPPGVIFSVSASDTIGVKTASKAVSSSNLGSLVLLHIRVTASALELYVNGTLAATTAFGTYSPPAGSQPFVGFDGTLDADDTFVFGMAYVEASSPPSNETIAQHFFACQEANDMVDALDNAAPGSIFTNIWSAKRGNNGFGQTGPGFPTANATWAPEVGNVSFTKVGTLNVRGFKNLTWASGASV